MALSGKVCTGVTKAMPSEVSGTARASPHHLWSKEGFQKFCLILSNLGRFKSFYFHQIYASLQDGSSEHTQKSTAKCTQGYKHFPITSCPHTTPIGYFRKKKKRKKAVSALFMSTSPKAQKQPDVFCPGCPKRFLTRKSPELEHLLGDFECCEWRSRRAQIQLGRHPKSKLWADTAIGLPYRVPIWHSGDLSSIGSTHRRMTES